MIAQPRGGMGGVSLDNAPVVEVHSDGLVDRPRAMVTEHQGQRQVGILLPNNQRQHRILYFQKDV